jgi:hypothetical protein
MVLRKKRGIQPMATEDEDASEKVMLQRLLGQPFSPIEIDVVRALLGSVSTAKPLSSPWHQGQQGERPGHRRIGMVIFPPGYTHVPPSHGLQMYHVVV